MKSSIFNNRIKYSDTIDIMYNSLTESTMLINSNSSTETVFSNSAIFDKLTRSGFLIGNNTDEFDLVSKAYYNRIHHRSSFRLTINPTLECNFRCWYCYETHTGNLSMTKETFLKVKNLISWIFDNYEILDLMFFGGEPMLKFDSIVKPLMEYVKEEAEKKNKKYYISFTSNAFLINKNIVEILKHYNIGHIQITLDGNHDDHNKTRSNPNKDSYLTIVDNVKLLLEAKINVILRINVTKTNINGSSEIPNSFADLSDENKKYINVIVQQVWQDKEVNDVDDGVLKLYKSFASYGIQIKSPNLNRILSPCYGDEYHSCVVNYNGSIYKCTAIDFDKFSSEGEIGENGQLVLKTLHYENRMRLWTRLCHDCRILPLCGGGCAKVLMGKNYTPKCMYPTDQDKNKLILRAIKEKFFMAEVEKMLQENIT